MQVCHIINICFALLTLAVLKIDCSQLTLIVCWIFIVLLCNECVYFMSTCGQHTKKFCMDIELLQFINVHLSG